MAEEKKLIVSSIQFDKVPYCLTGFMDPAIIMYRREIVYQIQLNQQVS